MFNDLKQNALSSKTSVWYVVGIFIDHCPGFNFDACHVFWELFRILSYFQENTKIDPMSYSIHIPSTHQTPKLIPCHIQYIYLLHTKHQKWCQDIDFLVVLHPSTHQVPKMVSRHLFLLFCYYGPRTMPVGLDGKRMI